MTLFIGWNAWSVLEYLMTGEKIEDTYFKIKDSYYLELTPSWLTEPFKMYTGQKVDRIYMPTSMTQEDIDFVNALNVQEMYYLEEGEYDYMPYKEEDKHFNIPLYTMNPAEIANKEVFSTILKLELTDDIIHKFLSLYDIWLPENKYDVILYTDPIEKDFGLKGVKEKVEEYMEKNHSGQSILVKAHPRDTTVWNWDMCSHRVPAQILLNRDVTHVFMYNTTVIRYLSKDKKSEYIDILTQGKE